MKRHVVVVDLNILATSFEMILYSESWSALVGDVRTFQFPIQAWSFQGMKIEILVSANKIKQPDQK
jgi:hypothetical protein